MNKCAFCGKKFCDTHRLSENHECIAHIVTDVKSYLIEQYEKIDAMQGDPAEVLIKNAEILATIKRPGVTIKLCDYIMENYPDINEAIYLAASQYEKLKDYKKALNLYRVVSEKVPDNNLYDRSYNLLAGKLVLEFKKRFRTAKESFDELEEKDQEIILQHPQYDELALKIDELYVPPRLRKMIADLKTQISENILPISQQIELIREKFPIDQIKNNPQKYSIDLGDGFSIFINLEKYPKIPEFEFPFFVEEKLDVKTLPERIYSLRTWSETQPYSLADVVNEIRACLGFFGFGKVQISQQFINLAKQTAREHVPNEFGAFIQLDRWVIWRLRLPQKYFSTPFATGYYKDQIPFMDSSVVGFIHSHTLGPAVPSDPDRQSFKLYYINMILGSTKSESSLDQLRVFDRDGKEREYEITTLLDDDVFPIMGEDTEKKPKKDLYL